LQFLRYPAVSPADLAGRGRLNIHGAWSIGAQLAAIGVAAGLATLAGGVAALRLRASIQHLMGFGTGAVIGVALMDLLPEALQLGRLAYRPLTLTALMAAGFMAYVMVDRLSEQLGERSYRLAKHIGPASLVFHSVMDGLGIGIAFNVSTAAGLIVAVAVLAHDLMDGANTITLGIAGNLGPRSMRRWLVLDALAPLLGIGLSRTVQTSPETLSALLAVFAGMFLYIGTAELLPRSRVGAVGLSGAITTLLGAAFMFVVVALSSG
jgi:zinc transporter ZupT